MRIRTPFVPAVIAAVLAVGTLAGCSTNGNSNYVTPQTPGSSSSAGSGSSSGSDSSSSSSSPEPTSQDLPADFPKADVPLADGTVVAASGGKISGWSVTVQPSSANGFADAQSALKDKGFSEQPGSTVSKAVFSSGSYRVTVATTGTSGDSVTYTVTATH